MANGHANLGWTNFAQRYGQYTGNVLFREFLVFFLPHIYSEEKGTLVLEEPLCICFMDTIVHETELCTFWTNLCVNKTLFPVRTA